MSQLRILWSLQQHDKRLAQLILKLKEVEREKKMEDLVVKLNQVEYDITNKKTQKEVDEVMIRRSNSKLDQITFDLKEIEKKLYDGSITDIKQLTYMSKEAQEVKKDSIKLEKDILNLMEETEKLEKELAIINQTYRELNEAMEKNVEGYESVIAGLTLEIKKEKINIHKILSRINDDLKQKYLILKQKKGKALALVVDGKCTGCHMAIPLSIMYKLKNKDEITYCDYCGKILYYKEQ